MNLKHTALALAAALTFGAAPASATEVIGNLANFDTVNNTGHSAYGFEIELEDAQLWDDSRNAGLNNSSKYVYDVFGLNRDFGLPGGPLGVVRFGAVRVENYDTAGAHAGVRITYGLAAGALPQAGAVFTQAAPAAGFSTPGESCWPGANANWLNNPCDHFGVSTAGNPLVTRYSWLVQATEGATLSRQLIGIPAVAYQALPPVAIQPGQPPAQPVVARIEAVEVEPGSRDERRWGSAVWVKTFTTVTKAQDINLGNLLIGQNGDADLNGKGNQVEIEWMLLQDRPRLADLGEALEGVDADEAQENRIELDGDGKSFIRRYEFYEYVGGYDDKKNGRALCASGSCRTDPEDYQIDKDVKVIGNFLGRQIAGFNADPALPALLPVPEPQTWATLLAGLLSIAFIARRRRG
jgi:hypothetical protein